MESGESTNSGGSSGSSKSGKDSVRSDVNSTGDGEMSRPKSPFQSLHETYAKELGRVGAFGFEEHRPRSPSMIIKMTDLCLEEPTEEGAAEKDEKGGTKKRESRWSEDKEKEEPHRTRRGLSLTTRGEEKESLKSKLQRLRKTAKMKFAVIAATADGRKTLGTKDPKKQNTRLKLQNKKNSRNLLMICKIILNLKMNQKKKMMMNQKKKMMMNPRRLNQNQFSQIQILTATVIVIVIGMKENLLLCLENSLHRYLRCCCCCQAVLLT